ncbi:MAG: ATP-dependent exonuclease SbcCD, C subunit-like protein [Gemmatimonas sp.]|nr:ATP-dependent exonuclease SbcCD, C subunit-like protein [Gemmatimonas sp.]
MTEALTETLLDFAPSDSRAGFRLRRFEVYNWGTFDQRVWTLEPSGENSLLTGDIGSGKSTLVDAVTTLLVPAHRITYNKAAGAESKERTLRSYVLGHYKSERGEAGLSTKAVALRDQNSYSVILGHFHNEGYARDVTLAQVFYIRDPQGQPDRFYVIADRPLSIATDFAGFGPDIKDLRKRLRDDRDLELHHTFPPYGASFRRRFGIDNDQALELFNQTVSMKSVGNLTEFVRSHMLEAFAVEGRIGALIGHFDNLDRAHQAVLKAKSQIAALEPLIADVDRYAALATLLGDLRSCRDALRPWFAELKSELLSERVARLDAQIERYQERAAGLSERCRLLSVERDEIRRAISDNGGDRIERLKADIARHEREQEDRRRRADAYASLTRQLGLPEAVDEAGFRANSRDGERGLSALENDEAEIQNRLTETDVMLRTQEDRHREVDAELSSLRQRRSNLPAAMLALRDRLCAELSVGPDALPFVGELLQVREDEGDWEGVIERLLHSFGLSLLVPDSHYGAVTRWVDRTQLRGRLVYYRVRERREHGLADLRPNSLVRKVAIQPDSGFYGWLEHELARKFDHACCTTLDEFRRERRAVTRAGQIKTNTERHEKDDRHAIEDRTRYVLGWSNEAKIAALEKRAADLGSSIETGRRRHEDIRAEQGRLREREGWLKQLAVYGDFGDLDWRPLTLEIQRLKEERTRLEAGSDVLRTLAEQLASVDQQHGAADGELRNVENHHAVALSKRETAEQMLTDARALLEDASEETKVRYFPQLEAMRAESIGDRQLTVESCDNREREMRDWLQGRIDADDRRLARLRDSMIDAMRRYKSDWPVETNEVDVSIDAAGEYRAMLEQLRADDLPRFEKRFKELLNENTIREVANFQAQLNREREEIRERIATINGSLRQIDYNPNRYICLQVEPAQDAEVREFRENLRACTEGALTGSDDEQYSEAKFLQVKTIIERFRGREGQTDLDQRWTRKVTDVRNWFVFSASERWREDDTEYEHYTDSGGKSGGQKEKLAYTVLAASLAYQFGLEWGEQRSRSFRFVVIDEAFGRGSDESTRYGLELFKKLNLQLLIVTPLQKIHVIEPYVANVGFVHNEDGRHSLLRNLTIEEYRAEQEARRLVKIS